MAAFFKRIYIVLIALCSFTSCLSVKPLEFERVENITLGKNGLQSLVNFNIVGHNPNSMSFKVTYLHTTVTIDGQSFANLQSDSVVSLAENSDFSIPASLTASQEDLTRLIASGLGFMLSGEEIPVKIKGDLTLKKFPFQKKFSFEFNEKIDPTKMN